MATIRTIVSDLFHRRSDAVLGTGFIGAAGAKVDRTLSPFYRVEELYSPVAVSINADDTVQLQAAAAGAANGQCLFFHDQWSTVAPLTRAQRIVAGGGYSGCLYSVYSLGNGEYRCVHTARPLGTMSDEYVRGVRAYAADQRWTLVHEVPTVGAAQVGGCVTTFLLTRVSYTINPTPLVRTVRLRQNAQGKSVAQDRFEDYSA